MFHFKNSAILTLALFGVACAPQGELGTLTASLTALDAEVDAFAQSQDELSVRGDDASDRSDLIREADRFETDARRQIDRMFDRIDDVARCHRDGVPAPTDRLVRDVSDLRDIASTVTDSVRDAATDPLARDRVTDFARISDRILDAIEDDISDLSDRASEYRCGNEAYECDDDPNTDDCPGEDRITDHQSDRPSTDRLFDRLDDAIRALDRAREVIVVICEFVPERDDLDRVTDSFRADAARRLDGIDAARDAVRDRINTHDGPAFDAVDQAFDALERAVDRVGDGVDQAGNIDAARDGILDELRVVDQRTDELSRATSDVRDAALGCDDDPNTDDC